MRSNIKGFERRLRFQQNRRELSGFQFITAIAVLAVIAAAAVPRVISAVSHTHSPQVAAAEQDLGNIEKGLELYKKDNGVYPTDEQGLLALIIKPGRPPVPANWQTGGYVDRLTRDPWGHPYQYHRSDNGDRFEVFSFGAAGPDGDGKGVIHNTH